MHWSQRRLCPKIWESLSFPKMYYSMPINMFFIVKNHRQPYFTDNPRICYLRNDFWDIMCSLLKVSWHFIGMYTSNSRVEEWVK
jgi:hypothetical protein